jgi:hypothetical protein
MLALRPVPAIPAQTRSVFLWGDAQVHGIALRTAARALTRGFQVACIDADMAFQIFPLVSMAKACRIPPDTFLRRVHLVRAFTCWQFTTLLCERLGSLLAAQPIGLVVLLNPLTHFFDEDVTFKEARRICRKFQFLG